MAANDDIPTGVNSDNDLCVELAKLKVRLKAEYLDRVSSGLRDETLPDALNTRALIINKTSRISYTFTTYEDAIIILDEIARGKGDYIVTPQNVDRISFPFLGNISETEIKSLSKLDRLICDAIFFNAGLKFELDLRELSAKAYAIDDSKQFMDELRDFRKEIEIASVGVCKKFLEEKLIKDPLKELEDATKLLPVSPLKIAGLSVHAAVNQALQRGDVSFSDMSKLNKFINGTTAVVNNPNDPTKLEDHRNNTANVIGMNRSWAKMVGGAMLSVLGAAIFCVSIPLRLVTFGVENPLSRTVENLGRNLIGAGVKMTHGAIAEAGEEVTLEAERATSKHFKDSIPHERTSAEASSEVSPTPTPTPSPK